MCGYMLDNSSINRNIKSFLSITTSASSSTSSSSAATTTPSTRTLSLSSFYCSARKFHLLYQCFTKRSDTNLQRPSRNWSKSSNNWQIVLLTIIIILLQCCTSHVLAIRKGRLMTPSTFTALSGDLHVQIQFSAEDIENDIIKTSTAATTTTTTTTTTTGAGVIAQTSTTSRTLNNQTSSGSDTQEQQQQQVLQVENIITSTLVISKYIDETNVSSAASDSGQPLATANDSLVLQRQRKEIIENILLYPDPRHNVTQVSVPCQTFMQGGLYEMQVVTNLKTTNTLKANSSSSSSKAKDATPTMTTTTTTLIPVYDERLRQTLDVRWPSTEMIVSPVRLRTYPDTPVEVTLRFPEVNCDNAWKREDLPEFWLELIYCGKERSCSQVRPENVTKSSILFAEQVRGYPKQKTFRLSCDLFGLAGNYAVQLRPMIPLPNIPITRRFLSVDWSEKYVFNVYARSIFPCDPHTGIGVLYEYPSCILEQGDRVRVYAKLRADVASLKPPTTLHYIAEQRVVKNQYSLYFNCDLFTEKFVEYCFVYVSQAISGAVADVRMDCVPTLPVRESDTGGWGPWSEWTPCSTNCLGGTRNRYRFCDSPPPRYGAKFCEGPSVQTEKCGKTISDTWDCIYETSGSVFSKLNRTDVSQEIGPGCRCGCIVHLGTSKPKRIIAGATQSCPGRSFWLIQVDGEETISLQLNFLRLPCATQYIKIRDGPSLSSTLLIEMQGGTTGAGGAGGGNAYSGNLPVSLESSGAQLLLEFYAGEETSITNNTDIHTGLICTGGFLANVEQIVRNSSETTLMAATRLSVKGRSFLQKPKMKSKFTLVHLSAVIFASIIILISALLGAQYVIRYRKYHLAVARRRDEGSRLHTPHASMSSLQSPPSRAVSTTTLISEVIYMVKMRPKHQLRHSILRESIDAENLARETEMSETNVKEPMVNVEEFGSNGSIVTLRNEIVSPTTESLSRSPSTEDVMSGTANESNIDDLNPRSCGTLTRKDSGKDTESIISSGMSSICNSPPMNTKRSSRYSERYDASTLKMTNSYLEEKTDCESIRSVAPRRKSRCASVNLTNGCYSPAASIISSATIRSTNPKESKEKQNRKKLLARPGSEFSLGNQEDFELDYYDYNVTNAGSVPGSYLGMDPAYLVWIPPFDDIPDSPERDEDKTPEPLQEPDETQPLYQEIKMPKYGHYLSPHSNTNSSNNTTNTSPTSEELSPLSSNLQSKATTPSETDLKNCLIRKAISSNSNQSIGGSKQSTPYLTRKQRKQQKQQSKSTLSLGGQKESIPLDELNVTRSVRNLQQMQEPFREQTTTILETDSMNGSYIEKETSVVKSPSDLQNYLSIDDIQFADESESDHDVALATLKPQQQRKMSEKEALTEECQLLRDMKRVSTVVAQNRAQTVRRTQVDIIVKCLRKRENYLKNLIIREKLKNLWFTIAIIRVLFYYKINNFFFKYIVKEKLCTSFNQQKKKLNLKHFNFFNLFKTN
ncbi:SCO-spondin [Lucilia cuprina]|nr:SCO-spondin [Lucilia cuprina]